MAKTRSMTTNQNLDDASTTKKIKTCDNGGVASWSDINHDMLFLVMMHLGVFYFVAFSQVCKSWRSLALPNRNMFMASKPPMLMRFVTRANKEECWLEDFEGRKFITILPQYDGWIFLGLSCGYLILFGRKTSKLWLVNPITRHELHFPPLTSFYFDELEISDTTAILVFSLLMSRWVLVILLRFSRLIWYSVAGEGAWNHAYSKININDVYAFKGKIYTINEDFHLQELRFNPQPKLTLLETRNFLKTYWTRFISSRENLCIKIDAVDVVYKLDFGEMKWVPFEETRDEYVIFRSGWKLIAAVKPESLAEARPWPQFRIYNGICVSPQARFWYFPYECLKVNMLNES